MNDRKTSYRSSCWHYTLQRTLCQAIPPTNPRRLDAHSTVVYDAA
jgi:hypothetical protein